MKSLVVEDEFISRSVLQRFLSRHGPCDVAVDGMEAVEAVRAAYEAQEPYQLICLDIGLPTLSGQEVLASVRSLERARGLELGQGTRVIMTTSALGKRQVMGAFRGGADAYLPKPIQLESLSRELDLLGLVRTCA
jgi:two-component system chemotaxis response regulator CheY